MPKQNCLSIERQGVKSIFDDKYSDIMNKPGQLLMTTRLIAGRKISRCQSVSEVSCCGQNNRIESNKTVAGKRIVLVSVMLFLILGTLCGQTTGDYRSNGTGNWSALATWQRWSGAAWAVPTAGQGYPGQNSSPSLVTILSNNTVTLNVSPANSISALSISPVTVSLATLQFNAGTLLTVSGTLTLGNAVNNNRRGAINMTGGGTLICNSIFLANSGANTFTPGAGTIQLNATNSLPSTIFTTFNNLVSNAGTTTLGVGIGVTGNLTIASGASLATNNFNLTLSGNFINGGTFTGGSSNVIITGTTVAQNIGAFSITGDVSMTKTAGTATLTGEVNGGGLIINGSGGTLNLGTGLVHTFTGNWTRTNGTLNGGSSFIRIGGAVSGTGGTFTAGTGSVEWNASGPQTIANVTYNNLSLSGSGTKTFPAAITCNGYLSISSGVVASLGTFTSSANTLTLGGLGQASGSWGSTSSPATNKNNTYFSATTGIVNVSAGLCAAYMGYGYERKITIDYTKVSGGSDLYNFPVLINLTQQNFLKNIPAGKVFSSSGFDIIFTDNSYNKLDHQIEYFNGTNGDILAWVRIPTLSSSSNTVIRILYENPLITSDQSVTSVWDSHYKGVWHLDNSNLNDFTSFNKAGTGYNSPSYPGGEINNSLGLNGSNQYAAVNNAANTNFAGNLTVSAWVFMNAGGLDQKIAGNQNGSGGGYKFGIYSNNEVEFEIRNAANTPSLNRAEPGGTVLNTGQWYYLAGISSDVLDSIKTFVNGIPERPFKKTGTLGTSSDNLTIGKEPWLLNYFFNGNLDELRISDEVRSNGWMRTEYDNQSSPSTFFSIDAVATSLDTLPSVSLCNAPFTLTYGYPAGGTYSGSYVAGNVFNPPFAGIDTIKYTYNSSCGPVEVSKYIVVIGTPAAPAASNKVYCSNQITYLEATSGVNIRWYSGGTLVSTANPFSTGQTAPGTYNYTVTQTVNGCESAATNVTLTIYGGITINTQPQPASICTTGSGGFSVSASGSNLTYRWQESGSDISDGGIYSGATTPALTITNPGTSKNGLSYRCVISTSCGTSPVNSNSAVLTVTALPVATFSYTGTPYCPNAPNPSPTFSGGGIAGTFSSTPGLVFVSTATGQINLSASTPGSYTVTNTIAAAGGCSAVIATSPVMLIGDLVWTGSVSTDWNNSGNWSCGLVPVPTLNVQIPNVANKPVLNSGAAGTVENLIIDNSSSLTISGNNIQISGTITNNGIFTASDGTIEMNGSVAQSIGSNVFAGNTIKNLIINNTAGVSLLGSLKITGIVTLQNGELSSGGNLTLLSAVAGTALIDGSGTGTVTGNVTMQRYLASGFGYKYFSSPFQAATVNEFLDNGISLLYRYDENRLVGGNPASGWVNYKSAANVLSPVAGYAINFGSAGGPNTVDVTGVVSNGAISVTLYNHNQIFTNGFNLIGNPYPSPIDWKAAAGWTKTNIDDALYYFKASATDQYGGTYSTYINGVSSDGLATRIIPSMQGFFVHVAATGPPWPVTGTLSLDNRVRTTDQTHGFLKSAKTSLVPLIRLVACFSDDTASVDPVVLYVDEKATDGFDSQADALKLFNTDLKVPNLYAVSSNETNLSIDALPVIDSSTVIPLGLKINRSGDVCFKIRSIESDFSNVKIILSDLGTGLEKDLNPGNEYRVNLASGDYKNRFYLNFRNNVITGTSRVDPPEEFFLIFSSHGILKADIKLLPGSTGILQIIGLTGETLFSQKVYESGFYEYDTGLKDGIYIATLTSENKRISKKLYIQNK